MNKSYFGKIGPIKKIDTDHKNKSYWSISKKTNNIIQPISKPNPKITISEDSEKL